MLSWATTECLQYMDILILQTSLRQSCAESLISYTISLPQSFVLSGRSIFDRFICDNVKIISTLLGLPNYNVFKLITPILFLNDYTKSFFSIYYIIKIKHQLIIKRQICMYNTFFSLLFTTSK